MAGVGFVRATSGMALSRDQALVELAKATRDLLLEVAATYRATITYQQLGVEVQRRAGIRAGQTPGWLMDVLAMVVHVCHRLAEPSLEHGADVRLLRAERVGAQAVAAQFQALLGGRGGRRGRRG